MYKDLPQYLIDFAQGDAGTLELINFTRRNNLEAYFNSKPETPGCVPSLPFRMNPNGRSVGVKLRTEKKSLVFEATICGQNALAEIDQRADNELFLSATRKALREMNIKLGDFVDIEKILDLQKGRAGVVVVARRANELGIPFVDIATDDLINNNEPFTTNAGRRDNSVTFSSSRAFYQAYAKEKPVVKFLNNGVHCPGLITLPAKLLAAQTEPCHTR